MGRPENDSSNRKTTVGDIQEKTNIFEDEINLIDYFRILWKRKWFVLLGSITPALIVGLIIFSRPRGFAITYTYDVEDRPRNRTTTYDVEDQLTDRTTVNVSEWNLDEKNYRVLLSRFYSRENLSRIVNKLRQEGLGEYAESLSSAGGVKHLKKLVKFEALPPYIDIIDVAARVKETDPAKLEKIRPLRARLLNITITGNPEKHASKISSVIRDNIENIMPVYLIAEQMNVEIREYRNKMATIEEDKFALQLALEKNSSILAKMKNMKTETSNKTESDVMLQFDVGARSEYLPVEYQIHAVKSQIIQLEETIKANERKYEYYTDLLNLHEKLLNVVKNNIPSDYNIQQFRLFLLESANEVKKEELKGQLYSLIKGIENRISTSKPVIENPSIYIVSKGTVRKSAIVFVISLMLSVFLVFLLEGIKKGRANAA